MAFGEKEWIVQYENHTIRVVNTWFAGAKLYIDGEMRDFCNSLFEVTGSSPVLSAKLSDNHIIEVYIIAIWSTKAKICLNGKPIGGDVF